MQVADQVFTGAVVQKGIDPIACHQILLVHKEELLLLLMLCVGL